MDKKKVKIGIIIGLLVLVAVLGALIYTGQSTFVPVVIVLLMACLAVSIGMTRKRD